jgi:hypothetical protein
MTTTKEAIATCGTLSVPSKMPAFSISTSAEHCITGSKLRDVENSVCNGCYAMKGAYNWRPTINAMEIRYNAVLKSEAEPEPWIDGMVQMISSKRGPNSKYFRWHDSGDLQGVYHLANIAQVALRTPNINHWIPTREYRIVKDYIAQGGIVPENLTIRISAHMVDQSAPDIHGLPKSEVRTTEDASCPSRFQDNSCGDCRQCWDSSVEIVSYYKH